MQRILVLSIAACLFLLLLVTSGCTDSHSSSLPRRGNTVTMRFINGSAPTWVAVQDGDGPWQVCQPTAAGTYAVAITNPEGRYSFAAMTMTAAKAFLARPSLVLCHATVAELPEVLVNQRPYGAADTATVTGTVSGVADQAHGMIALNGGGMYVGSTATDYSLSVAPGQRDILAALWPSSTAELPERIAMLRDCPVTDAVPYIADFNFASLPAANFATINTNSPAYVATVKLATDDGATLTVADVDSTSPRASIRYACPSPEQQAAGDRYFAEVLTEIAESSWLGVQQSFSIVGDRTLAFPAPLGAVTTTLNTTGAMPVPTVTWTPYPADFYTLEFRQALRSDMGSPYYSAIITRGWLHGATSYTVPAEFCTLSGWDTKLNMQASVGILVDMKACSTNLPIMQALAIAQQPYPADGTVAYAAVRSSTFGDIEPTAQEEGHFSWFPSVLRPAAE